MTPTQPSESPARRGSVQNSQPAPMPTGRQSTAAASAATAAASQPRRGSTPPANRQSAVATRMAMNGATGVM